MKKLSIERFAEFTPSEMYSYVLSTYTNTEVFTYIFMVIFGLTECTFDNIKNTFDIPDNFYSAFNDGDISLERLRVIFISLLQKNALLCYPFFRGKVKEYLRGLKIKELVYKRFRQRILISKRHKEAKDLRKLLESTRAYNDVLKKHCVQYKYVIALVTNLKKLCKTCDLRLKECKQDIAKANTEISVIDKRLGKYK